MFPGSNGFNLAAFILCMVVSICFSTYFSYKKSAAEMESKRKEVIDNQINNENLKLCSEVLQVY